MHASKPKSFNQKQRHFFIAAILSAAMAMTASAPRAQAGDIGLGITLTAAGGGILAFSALGFLATDGDPNHYDDCYNLNGENAREKCAQNHRTPLYVGMGAGALGLGVGIPLIVHGVRARRAARLQQAASGTTLDIAPVLAADGAKGALFTLARVLP